MRLRLFIATLLLATSAVLSSQTASPPTPPQRAVGYVLRSFARNPLLPPEQQLPADGKWQVTTKPSLPLSAECQAPSASCIEVIYSAPAPVTDCRWTVLLPVDPQAEPAVLNENEQAARLLVRSRFPAGFEITSTGKALPNPVYPAIAAAAHVAGKVDVQIVVDGAGKVSSAKALSGSSMLLETSAEAAKATTFVPLQVGQQNSGWIGVIEYTFSTSGPGSSRVAGKLLLSAGDAQPKRP